MRIIVVSDTHLSPRARAFNDNWAAVRTDIVDEAPNLVVHLGDITADGEHDPQELRAVRPLFDGLAMPLRFLPGNHDIGDNPIAPGANPKTPVDRARLGEYRRLFGPDYWRFDAEGWRIIGLNAQLFGSGLPDEEEQFAWLRAQVGDCRTPVGVMLHKPLYRNGPHDTEAHVRYVPLAPRCRLLTVLAGCDLRFVLSGHTHQARRIDIDGVEHRWAPSTAFWIPDELQERIGEKVLGVLALDLAETTHRFYPVTSAGLISHNLADHPDVYPELRRHS